MLELGTKEFTVRNIIASLLVKEGLDTSYVYAKFFDLYFIEDLLVQHRDLEDYDLKELTKKELSYLVQLDWNNLKTTNSFRQELIKRINKEKNWGVAFPTQHYRKELIKKWNIMKLEDNDALKKNK